MAMALIIGHLVSFVQPGIWGITPYILEFPAYFGGRFTVPEDNPMSQEGVELGRKLFYEEKLSKGNKISCASCHQQQLAFTDGKAFSEGVDGSLTKRSSMSLANLLWVRNFFWDGRASALEDQAIFPLTDPHEMGQELDISVQKLEKDPGYGVHFEKAFGTPEISGDRIVRALSQFERALISSNSPYDHFLKGEYALTDLESLGLELFMTVPAPLKGIRGANCGHCHGTPKMYKELYHNNGLDSRIYDIGRMAFTGSEVDRGRFRVPTLRNIALTAPYMHDGRFASLQEVLDHYSDHVQLSPGLSPFISEVSNEENGKQLSLSSKEKSAIIAFLHTLTDSSFILNPKFSDPNITSQTP